MNIACQNNQTKIMRLLLSDSRTYRNRPTNEEYAQVYDEALRHVKSERNARFRGLIRAAIVFKRMRLRAALKIYAPGGTGFEAGAVTGSSFVSNVTGNVTGNATGLAGSVTQGTNIHVGVVTATSLYGDGSNMTGIAATNFNTQTVTANGAATTIDTVNVAAGQRRLSCFDRYLVVVIVIVLLLRCRLRSAAPTVKAQSHLPCTVSKSAAQGGAFQSVAPL